MEGVLVLSEEGEDGEVEVVEEEVEEEGEEAEEEEAEEEETEVLPPPTLEDEPGDKELAEVCSGIGRHFAKNKAAFLSA